MTQSTSTSGSGLDDLQANVFHPGARPAPAAPAAPSAATVALGQTVVATPTLPDGPIAIVSDIHANLEALTAVLANIDERGLKTIICLGDVVGYGPNPLECVDLISSRTHFSLMGNHDFAMLFEPYNFNQAAENAAFWTRTQFEGERDTAKRNNRWKYLCSMPTRVNTDRFYGFHGSPRRPINEYVFPDDIYTAPQKLAAIFDRFPHLCFVGHTHVPGVFLSDPDFYAPEEVDNRYKITEERAMINVGSVGQPRDRNPEASYVVLHPDAVEFIRLPYDVNTTVEKIRAIPELDNFLAARLLEGK